MSEILTFTGKMFDPIAPDPALIDIRDIAHALSFLCRANGHFKTFHSVAQHCLECMQEARARGLSSRLQLACLLHDGSEAYLSDVTRPVKAVMPAYLEYETPLQEAIWNKFLEEPLTQQERQIVFGIDDDLLYHEFYTHTGMRLSDTEPVLLTKPSFAYEDFAKVEQAFLRAFSEQIPPVS